MAVAALDGWDGGDDLPHDWETCNRYEKGGFMVRPPDEVTGKGETCEGAPGWERVPSRVFVFGRGSGHERHVRHCRTWGELILYLEKKASKMEGE